MTVRRRKLGRTRGLGQWFLLMGLTIACALAGPSPAFAGQATDSTPALKPGYVGIVGCNKEACHEKEKTTYLTNAHGRTGNPDTPAAADDCETCHGPGEAHMANTGEKGRTKDFLTMSARDANAVCLTSCHENYRLDYRFQQADYVESMHARRDVACVNCHSNHSPMSKKALLKTTTDSETCYTCHKSKRLETLRASHHPVREGEMGCSSCHDPHDGSRPTMLQADSVNELCYTCHTEKRGPFLYEHAPVREDCVSCHQPHGSNHARMLQAKPPFLCQRCHYSGHGITGDFSNTDVGGVYPGADRPPGINTNQTSKSARFIERSCSNCHLTIHGSNSPSGQFFVR